MAILKIRDNSGNVVEIPAIKGTDGIGIKELYIDSEGCLVVEYSNGRVVNLGPVVGEVAAAGESAYEIAVRNGFVGTEKEWLDSLVPKVGENGTWVVEGQDTGVKADASTYTFLSPDEINNILT